jgi:hypothetical protein
VKKDGAAFKVGSWANEMTEEPLVKVKLMADGNILLGQTNGNLKTIHSPTSTLSG